MFQGPALVSMLVFLAVFLGVCAVFYWRFQNHQHRALARLRQLAEPEDAASAPAPGLGQVLQSALPRLGKMLMPRKEERLAGVQRRLVQGGLYGPHVLRLFLALKLVLMLLFGLLAAALSFVMPWTLQTTLTMAIAASAVGLFGPDAWLRRRMLARQCDLRRALPDALDMLVLCLEGGISLLAAWSRVADELKTAHPALGLEMNIMQREIQLGLSVGEALKKFGDRCGLEEVRELASVILQFERFGTGVVKALRTHADSWRQERQLQAEEHAHKAAVKILFPTLLCIFPAIFIVLLGPAAYQLTQMFSK